MKTPKSYDSRHPFCVPRRSAVQWLGDPARGEFVTVKMQPKKKRATR